MARYKVLRSIAHNVAHSYLSLMNYIQDDYIVEYIFQIAKTKKKPYVEIDILNLNILPEEYRIPPISQSLGYLNKNFQRMLFAEHLTLENIKSAIIKIEFDLDNIIKSEYTDLEKPTYSCISEIVDINDKLHQASVVEWWRY